MKKSFFTMIIVMAVFGAFAQSSITPTQIATTGNNLIDASNPRAADIVIGSDAGIRHDASIMWWSASSASRISNTNDIFNFSVWKSTNPNISLSATVGGPSYFQGRVGIGTTGPNVPLHVVTLSSPNGDVPIQEWDPAIKGYLLALSNYNSTHGIDYRFTQYNGNTLYPVLTFQAGRVGINTQNPDATLAVAGNIHTQSINVDMTGWSDYVLKSGYNLHSLQYVKSYIDKNGHLPDVPSEQQVKKEGIDLGEMNSKLLKKIEELTLYLIEKDKQLKDQQDQINTLSASVKQLLNSVKINKNLKHNQ